MQSDYKKILEECKQYASMRFDLLRLELLEKLSKIISLILLVIVCIFIATIIFTYLSVLLLLWLNEIFSSMIPGVCIVAGIYAVVLAIILTFKDKIFLNPIVGALSKIIFSEKSEDVEPINEQL